jgi:hypothetical protein
MIPQSSNIQINDFMKTGLITGITKAGKVPSKERFINGES